MMKIGYTETLLI